MSISLKVPVFMSDSRTDDILGFIDGIFFPMVPDRSSNEYRRAFEAGVTSNMLSTSKKADMIRQYIIDNHL